MSKFITGIFTFFLNVFSKATNTEMEWNGIKFPIVDTRVVSPVRIYSGFKQHRKVKRTTKLQLKNLSINMYYGPEGEKQAFKEWLKLNPDTNFKSIEDYRKASRKEKAKYMYWVYAVRPTHANVLPIGYCVYFANTDENQFLAVVNSKRIPNDVRAAYISNIHTVFSREKINNWSNDYFNRTGWKWQEHVSSTSRTFDEEN